MFGIIVRMFRMGGGKRHTFVASRGRANQFRPRVRACEDRMLLSGIRPFVGPIQYPPAHNQPMPEGPYGQGADDLWLGTGTNPTLWSEGDNWQLNRPPGSVDKALFDGLGHDNPCEVDAKAVFPVAGIGLVNGYAAQITIDANVVAETTGGLNSDSTSKTNIDFKSSGSALNLEGGESTLYTFTFSDQGGTVVLWARASLTLNNTGASSTTATFQIAGELYADNTATVAFQGQAGIEVEEGGTMYVDTTPNVGQPLTSTGTGIITNYGTFNFAGLPDYTTTINMAFLNYGEANFNEGSLFLTQTSNTTGGRSYKMVGGSTNLGRGVAVFTTSGYYQTGGKLAVTDSSPAVIDVKGAAGELDGGNVVMGPSDAFGSLTFLRGDLIIGGAQVDAKIDGPGGIGGEDRLLAGGAVTIRSGSLVVTAINGAVAANQSWLIIGGGAVGAGDFPLANKTFPALGMSSRWNPLDPDNYYVYS